MNGKLLFKVNQGEKRVGIIEPLLVLPVAALHLAIMSGSIRTDLVMLNTQLGGCFLKKGLDIPLAVGKRLVNSKPLSVWTHSTWMPLRAYHLTNRFKKSAEE